MARLEILKYSIGTWHTRLLEFRVIRWRPHHPSFETKETPSIARTKICMRGPISLMTVVRWGVGCVRDLRESLSWRTAPSWFFTTKVLPYIEMIRATKWERIANTQISIHSEVKIDVST